MWLEINALAVVRDLIRATEGGQMRWMTTGDNYKTIISHPRESDIGMGYRLEISQSQLPARHLRITSYTRDGQESCITNLILTPTISLGPDDDYNERLKAAVDRLINSIKISQDEDEKLTTLFVIDRIADMSDAISEPVIIDKDQQDSNELDEWIWGESD